jgi:hypothetical protein
MTGRVVVLDSEEYRQKYQGGFRPAGPAPATQPTTAPAKPDNVAMIK